MQRGATDEYCAAAASGATLPPDRPGIHFAARAAMLVQIEHHGMPANDNGRDEDVGDGPRRWSPVKHIVSVSRRAAARDGKAFFHPRQADDFSQRRDVDRDSSIARYFGPRPVSVVVNGIYRAERPARSLTVPYGR